MLFELRLLRIRRKQQVKLNSENRNVFNKIRQYIDVSPLVFFEKEEVLQQILDIMLQAQNDGKDINLFLGRNHKEFCDSIIKEYSTTKSLVLRGISFIEQLILFTMMGMLFDMIFYNAPVFKINTIITTGGLLLILFPRKRKPIQEKIYSQNKYLVNKPVSYRGLITFALYLLYSIVVFGIFSAIGRKKGVDLLSAHISIFSARYFIIIGIIFIVLSEVFKSVCNKQRTA